jgi:DNA sulfur modification protein DndD
LNRKNELLTQIDVLRKQVVVLTAKKMQLDETLKSATQEFEKTADKLKDVLKEKSISDITARAALAFDELRNNLYRKYIAKVELAFIQSFNLLLTKDNLLDGVYISKDFEVIPYKNSILDVKEVRTMLANNGDEYALEHLGERAFSMVKEHAALDGQIELPVKIEQHFSAGEQQIFAMALYQALSEIRTTDIPFVIDTPLARIDGVHRKNILNNFFSKLPDQVVILSTDEEIDMTGISILQEQLSDLYLIENQDDGSTKALHNQYFEGVSH